MASSGVSAAQTRWAHAVNSRQALDQCIAMRPDWIETDVTWGHWETGSSDGASAAPQAILAHPPAASSDLTPELLLETLRHLAPLPGIKLDFKELQAVEPTLRCVQRAQKPVPIWSDRDIWLNADVLPGPGGAAPGIDAPYFLHHCRARLPNSTLSLGWTTSKAVWPWDAAYTFMQTEAMRGLCRRHELRNVTLAVSAFHASLRPEPVLRLLADQPNFTVTFWGEAPPWVRRWIDRVAAEVGEDRVYVDIKPCPLGLALWHAFLAVCQPLLAALAGKPQNAE